MKKIIDNLSSMGRGAAITAGTGIGVAKIIDAAGEISEKPKEKQLCTVAIIGAIIGFIALCVCVCQWIKGMRYRTERMADADAEILKMEAKTRYEKSNSHKVPVEYSSENTDSSKELGSDPLGTTNDPVSWFEYYHDKFPILPFDLPPIISDYVVDCPDGFEEAIIAQLTTALGTVCCSRVQAKYEDGNFKRANLQTIIEAPSGSGKSIFERIHSHLLFRRIDTDKKYFMEFKNMFTF